MCGIFGIFSSGSSLSRQQIATILLKGLSMLEYRGYDSAGIGLVDTQGRVFICKSEGNVAKLQKKVNKEFIMYDDNDVENYSMGIAHTRWATHGPPSDINSHPHTSGNDASFMVVHNGIIANNKTLRKQLGEKGYKFLSQTDTEVVPVLCEAEYKKEKPARRSFVQLVIDMTKQLEGTYALLITSKYYENEIIACRQGSPLIVGIDDDNKFTFSSDTNAMTSSKFLYVLKDNELLFVGQHGYMLMNIKTGCLIQNIPWVENHVKLDEVEKGSYGSYMEKEIFEQPSSLTNTISKHTGSVMYDCGKNRKTLYIEALTPYINQVRNARSFVLIACGTSFHSCIASRLLLANMLDKDVHVECAGQFAEVNPRLHNDNVYMFVSQSGETADTLEALRYVMKNSRALTIGITNKPDSAIAREAHCSIELNAGTEISVASTKAYSSQLTMFVMMALCLKEKTKETQAVALQIPDFVKHSLTVSRYRIQEIANEVKNFRSMLFIGRGNDYATCLEAALKVKEIAYIHSEGVLASELKHGPLAMIDNRVCMFVFATKNEYYQKMVSVVEQLKARDATLYVVCDQDDENMSNIVNDERYLIRVPSAPVILQHIVNIIPMQLLAYYLAILKGHSVDQPRNLAKSVTVAD